MLPSTAMLSGALTVSTGLDALDDVLGGLYWGDNVVWQFDGTPVEPFYSAIASQSAVFETKTVVSLGSAVNTYGIPGRHDRWTRHSRRPATCCARSTGCAIPAATGWCCSSRSTAWCARGA